MNKEYKDLLYLAGCAVNRKKPDANRINTVDLDLLYKAAERHQLVSVAAYALEAAGLYDERFERTKNGNIYKMLLFDEERKKIAGRLENAEIWFLPLKGAVLKDYYPSPDMRQMSDIDILYDAGRADAVRNIMEEMGYKTAHFGYGHQDDYEKKPVLHFEMHRMLYDSTMTLFYRYYKDIKDRLVLVEGSDFQYRFTNEDFYISMITHMFKHYFWEGMGLKTLLDIYVFLKRFSRSMDHAYIAEELKKLGIDSFEKRVRCLTRKIFPEGNIENLTRKERRMLESVADAGDYAVEGENTADNALGKIFQRLYIPVEAVRVSYPFFGKYKILLPVLPAYRLISRWGRAKSEIRAILKK